MGQKFRQDLAGNLFFSTWHHQKLLRDTQGASRLVGKFLDGLTHFPSTLMGMAGRLGSAGTFCISHSPRASPSSAEESDFFHSGSGFPEGRIETVIPLKSKAQNWPKGPFSHILYIFC